MSSPPPVSGRVRTAVAAPPDSFKPPAMPALTGLRFLAALHVVLFHYASDVLAYAPAAVRAVVAAGPSSVGLFYVLSGAVITYSYADRRALTSSRSRFWQARFARIYPTYLFGLMLDAPFFVASVLRVYDGASTLPALAALAIPALLLIHAWTPVTVFVWNTPGWSVSVEAFFYALFPRVVDRYRCETLAVLVRRVAWLYLAAAVPLVIALIARRSDMPVLAAQLSGHLGGLEVRVWIERLCGFTPIARLPEFLMGICLGHWLRQRRGNRSWPTAVSTLFEAIVLMVLIGCWVVLGSHPSIRPALDSGLLAPIFGCLIGVLALGTGQFARLLSWSPLLVLGEASYAIYVLQEPVLNWMKQLPIVSLPGTAFIPLYLLVLTAIAILWQRSVAEPLRLRLRRTTRE